MIALLFCICITTDVIRDRYNQNPIFVIHTNTYKDGWSKKYVELLHNVYAVHEMRIEEECFSSDGIWKDEYEEHAYRIYKKLCLGMMQKNKKQKDKS